MEKKPNAHVAEYKKKVVSDVVKLLKSYPIIGALNMENLPASALQVMRAKMRKDVVLYMTKKRLINIAIEDAKKDVKGLELLKPYLKGMPALLFTRENPFKLYKTIAASKSPAAAKAGQISPMNITIPAGPTPFAPGPIIGELAQFGIKAKVEAGKVAIAQDAVVVKEGEVIKQKVADLLTRFAITPMELGLDLVAVCEGGVIYDKKVLAVDEKKFLADLERSAAWAFNLAVEAGYATKDTINVLIAKAHREARAVAKEGNIMNSETAAEMVEKAEREMLSLKEEAKLDEAFANLPAKEVPKAVEHKPEERKAPEHHEKPQGEEKKTSAEVGQVKILEKKEVLKPTAALIKEVKVQNPEPDIRRIVTNEKAKEAKQGENLFEELKKKGTLRGIEALKESPKQPSPMDIVKRANKEL